MTTAKKDHDEVLESSNPEQLTPPLSPSEAELHPFDNADDPSAVVGGGDKDDVYLSRATSDTVQKKSLTNHHLQRRLVELGFDLAGADIDGRYGALTQAAVAEYQVKHKVGDGSGVMDEATFKSIFSRDKWVNVILL
jgi:peptidoglycan hydrolase-like protein with peptidoglycan-binding domain